MASFSPSTSWTFYLFYFFLFNSSFSLSFFLTLSLIVFLSLYVCYLSLIYLKQSQQTIDNITDNKLKRSVRVYVNIYFLLVLLHPSFNVFSTAFYCDINGFVYLRFKCFWINIIITSY